jgi:hypothetical protein
MKIFGNDLTSKLIGLTLFSVTVTVFTGSVTDPVNVTKFFVLGGFAFAALGSILNPKSIKMLLSHKIPLFGIAFFLVASAFVMIMSGAPFSQSIYGVYGRNNGFLLYLMLAILFVSTLAISQLENLKVVLKGLFLAGSINLIYSFWVIAFGDFIPWNNIYGNLLGTLGNPNFIGSFFGIFSGLIFALSLAPTVSTTKRILLVLLLLLTFVGIIETSAVQGKVLFVASGGIVGFYWIRSKFSSNAPTILYLGASFIGFVMSALGTQQIGPLTRFLYKETVTLRGEYWFAGWQTGISNPLAGVGFDSFGDWYRRSRRESSLTLPGVDTVTNAAHNVYLDMFAFGGWPLFLSYVILNLLVVVAIIRVTLRRSRYDVTFISLVSIWVCYQLQSVISINQIGLAIWGWISSAAILAFERLDRNSKPEAANTNPSRRKVQRTSQASSIATPGLIAGVFSILGMLIAVPPLSADMKWYAAQRSQDVNKLISTLDSNYMNPLSSFRFNNIVGVLETNNFSDQAREVALRAVAYNPESFESWRNITLLKSSSAEERLLAYKNMKILDPLNPNIDLGSK